MLEEGGEERRAYWTCSDSVQFLFISFLPICVPLYGGYLQDLESLHLFSVSLGKG